MNNDIQIRAYKPGEPSLVVNFYYRLFEKCSDIQNCF